MFITRKRLPFKQSEPSSIFFCADLHIGAANVDYDFLVADLQEAKDTDSRIIINGDIFDAILPKDSKRYKPEALHPRISQTSTVVDATVDWGEELLAPFADNIDVIGLGNHECHDDETEILTRRGWVYFRDLEDDDEVGTFHRGTGTAEFQKPWEFHDYEGPAELIYGKNSIADFAVTGNHRMVFKSQGENERWKIRVMEELGRAPESELTLPMSANSGLSDSGVASDDELRMAAWLLTDGTIAAKDAVVIYQSGEKVSLITDIIDRLGWKYRVGSRQRNTAAIAGRELVSKPQVAHEVFILAGPGRSRLLELVPVKDGHLPEWVMGLSDRQFHVFLSAFVDGDGSRHPSCPNTSWMAYGLKPILDDLQAACVTHGWRASLTEYRDGDWRLNLCPRLEGSLKGKKVETRPYSGRVWCVTVPNGTTITRRNGRVLISGNSSVEKWNGTDMVARLIRRLNSSHVTEDGHIIKPGGYTGFVDYRFSPHGNPGNGNNRRLTVYYHHGGGGASPVTKGMIDFSRKATFIDSDVVVLGHKHNKISDTGAMRMSCPMQGDDPVTKQQVFIMTGAYMDTYQAGRGGYASDWGLAPQAKGGARLLVHHGKTGIERLQLVH